MCLQGKFHQEQVQSLHLLGWGKDRGFQVNPSFQWGLKPNKEWRECCSLQVHNLRHASDTTLTRLLPGFLFFFSIRLNSFPGVIYLAFGFKIPVVQLGWLGVRHGRQREGNSVSEILVSWSTNSLCSALAHAQVFTTGRLDHAWFLFTECLLEARQHMKTLENMNRKTIPILRKGY